MPYRMLITLVRLYYLETISAFLKEESTECVREVSSLATQCDTLPALSYSAYALGFKVVMVNIVSRLVITDFHIQ